MDLNRKIVGHWITQCVRLLPSFQRYSSHLLSLTEGWPGWVDLMYKSWRTKKTLNVKRV